MKKAIIERIDQLNTEIDQQLDRDLNQLIRLNKIAELMKLLEKLN